MLHSVGSKIDLFQLVLKMYRCCTYVNKVNFQIVLKFSVSFTYISVWVPRFAWEVPSSKVVGGTLRSIFLHRVVHRIKSFICPN